jgi:hypothetical protein
MAAERVAPVQPSEVTRLQRWISGGGVEHDLRDVERHRIDVDTAGTRQDAPPLAGGVEYPGLTLRGPPRVQLACDLEQKRARAAGGIAEREIGRVEPS